MKISQFQLPLTSSKSTPLHTGAICALAALSGVGLMARAQQRPAALAAQNAPRNAAQKPVPTPPRFAPGTQSKATPVPPAMSTPVGAQPIQLRMKFKTGDTNKYQMTEQATMLLPDQSAAMTAQYNTDINMVIQQRVTKTNPDGSAEIAIATLSGTGTVSGQSFAPDTKSKPALITFDTRNNIVSAKDLPQSANSASMTSQMFQSGGLSTQGVYLPKQPVRVGDKWTQKLNIASLGKGSEGTVQTTFVRMEPVGLYQTARLRSLLRIPFVNVDSTANTPVVLKGMLNMTYTSNLAVAEGKVVRSTGEGDITVVVVNTPIEGAPTPAATNPGKKANSASKPVPPAAPRVTVKLHMGNNLITQ